MLERTAEKTQVLVHRRVVQAPAQVAAEINHVLFLEFRCVLEPDGVALNRAQRVELRGAERLHFWRCHIADESLYHMGDRAPYVCVLEFHAAAFFLLVVLRSIQSSAS